MTGLPSERRVDEPRAALRRIPWFDLSRWSGPAGHAARLGRQLSLAWPVFVVFLVQRILTMAFLHAAAPVPCIDLVPGADTPAVLPVVPPAGGLCAFSIRWDAGWYLRLAQGGYVYPNLGADGTERASNLAYFPLFPWLVRNLGTGQPFSLALALLIVSWFGGLLAVWAIFAVGNHLYGRGPGIALAALWGMAPASLALTMGYPEGMFTAAAAATVLCLIRRRPVLAGASALVAGLLRPSAVAVIAAVVGYALVELVRWLRRRREHARAQLPARHRARDVISEAIEDDRTAGGRPPVPALVGAALACSGLGAFMIYVWYRTGDVVGYFTVQGQWGQKTAAPGEYWSSMAASVMGPTATYLTAINVVVCLGYVLLFCLIVFDRQLVWASVFAAGILLTALSHVTFQHVYARQLLPAFVLLIPLVRIKVPRIGAIAAITVGSVVMAWASAQFLLIPSAAL